MLGSEAGFPPGIRIPSQAVDPNTRFLYAPLTDEQIEAIEEQRAGGAVIFKIALSGLVTIPSQREQTVHYMPSQGRSSPAVAEPTPRRDVHVIHVINESGAGGQPVRIEREHWIQIMKGLEAGKCRLIELPQPSLPPLTDRRWAECVHLLCATPAGT